MNFYFRHHNIRVKKVDIFVKNVWHMEKVGFLRWIEERLLLFTKMYSKIFLLEIKTALGVKGNY